MVCPNQSTRRLLSVPEKTTRSPPTSPSRSVSRDGANPSPPSAGGSPRSSLTIPARVRRSRPLAVTGPFIAPSFPRPRLLRPRPPGHPQNVRWRAPGVPDTLADERWQPGTEQGDMDEIGQDPKLNVGFPRGRWLDVAVAVALIAAAVLAVMTGRGSRPAAAPTAGPGAAASPALLPSTVRARIPVPFGQPGGITVLGSTAWISDWSASRIAGVDLAARQVTRTVRVGDQQHGPVSMTSGAGSLWVLDFAGPLLRIDPASGAITKRFPVRGLGADVAYGNGYIWMITDDPAVGGGQEYLYKIDPSRDVIVKAAPIPGTGTACAASPGPYGIWIACAAVDRITLISQGSLKPVQSLRVHSGGYIPQIVPGRNAVWVLPLTAYPVAHTPDLTSAAADGPAIWAATDSTLIMLQDTAPTATQHT